MKHSASVVAVQIVTHNNETTIFQCLTALKKQSFRRFVICIIDNCSTDNTIKIAKRFSPETIVMNQKNVGYAAGHNQAIRLIDSEYVLTLNPDVLLDVRYIEQMVREVGRAPISVGSAAGLLYRVNNLYEPAHKIDGAGLYLLCNRRQLLRYEGKNAKELELVQGQIFGPDGAAAFYRRKMLQDIDLGDGVFDEDFFMHKEDVDVCWRAQLRGWSSLFIPTAHARHIRTFRAGQRQSIDVNMKMMAVRNRYYLMIKNELAMLYLRDMPFIIWYELAIIFYIIFKEQSSLVAYVQILRQLPRMLQKRSRIQANRLAQLPYMSQWFQWGRI